MPSLSISLTAERRMPAMQHKGDAAYSTCGQKGVSVKPKKGDALMFYNLLENGRADGTSLHQGCPVIKGDKWTATKRILVNRRPLDDSVQAFRQAITSGMMVSGINSLTVPP